MTEAYTPLQTIAYEYSEAFVIGLDAALDIVKFHRNYGTLFQLEHKQRASEAAMNKAVMNPKADNLPDSDFIATGVAISVAFDEEIRKQGDAI